ncbi:uncharacterized protein LOC141629174 [Silene latifolia]|uniref:uncharacterized protein LOC141629174 n=1 Tax=Silene latifolia TaxID=37657 RepID=UPI003D77E3F1
MVCELITPDKQWNVSKLASFVSKDIVSKILDVPIPWNDLTDKMGWGISVDGAFSIKSAACVSYSIRNHHGKILLLGAKSCGNISVLLAETMALRESIIAAKTLGYTSIAIEGDNLCVINSIRGTWEIPWEISSFIADITIELSQFKEVKNFHCFREANKVPDFMANLGHSCHFISR